MRACAEGVVAVSGIGCAGDAALIRRRRNPHQLLRIGKRQRAQQQRVHYAEDSNVSANAEGEDENGDDGEPPVAAKSADGVAEILEENVESHNSSRFALLVFRQVNAAKANQRLAAGFKRGKAALDVLRSRHLDVRGDLGFELCVEWGLAKEGSYASQRSPRRLH